MACKNFTKNIKTNKNVEGGREKEIKEEGTNEQKNEEKSKRPRQRKRGSGE